MDRVEQLATILAVTRVKSRRITQPDRVQRLLLTGDPAVVLSEVAEQTLFDDPALERARIDIEQWLELGYGIVTVLDKEYPVRLRDVREAPAILYYEGDLQSTDQGVCVVGSRQADDAALDVASCVSRALVDAGLTVVSGLAAGIDAAAHTSALEAGGRTVAVMGTGLEKTYPRQNSELRQRIVGDGGLVITQFEPGATITRASFPMRNAVMSGYGITTFVVAASEHSGTRNQAKNAVRHGRGVTLSHRVTRETSWGSEMVNSGKALVAKKTTNILEHVRTLQADRALAEELLHKNSYRRDSSMKNRLLSKYFFSTVLPHQFRCRVCQLCRAPVNGYEYCYQCNAASDAHPDAAGFVSYAIDGHQAGWDMYSYKGEPTSAQAVNNVQLLLEHGLQHLLCVGRIVGTDVQAVAVIPSRTHYQSETLSQLQKLCAGCPPLGSSQLRGQRRTAR